MTMDHRILDRLNELDVAFNVAQQAALNTPDELREARRVSDEIAEIATEPPLPARPIDPARPTIEQLDEQAALRSQMTTRRLLAEEAQPAAIGALQRATLNALPAWISELQERFADILAAMREVATETPKTDASGLARLDAKQFDTWQKFARLAASADDVLSTRLPLGMLRREALTNDAGNPPLTLCACVAVPEVIEPRVRRDNAGVTVIGEVAEQHRERFHRFQVLGTANDGDTVLRWLHLLEAERAGWLHLGLASLADVRHRQAALSFWHSIPFGQGAQYHGAALAGMRADSTSKHASTPHVHHTSTKDKATKTRAPRSKVAVEA